MPVSCAPAEPLPWLANPGRVPGWSCPPVSDEVLAFHRGLPDYAPTPLVELPALARELGVARVLAKDESRRLGLPAFKALGASWALHRAVHRESQSVTIVTATDGNHGRAVARFARLLGHQVQVFVPEGVHATAVQAIRDEGAQVTSVAADYDQAVCAAAEYAARVRGVLVQDTGWEGYQEVPGWIVDGYATLFHEIDDQLGDHRPDLVLVPTGVGSLLQAALAHYRCGPTPTAVVSVEPEGAACVQASVAAGRPVSVDTGTTTMAGLNCGTVSSLAWPYIHPGLDGAATVTDDQATAAARDLGPHGVAAGPCGAAALAAARNLVLSPDATLVLLVTEGATANPSFVP